MGVIGCNRLLSEHGYLPDQNSTSCCSVSLWNEDHNNVVASNNRIHHSPFATNTTTGTTHTSYPTTNNRFGNNRHHSSTYTTRTTRPAAAASASLPSSSSSSSSKHVAIPYGSEFHVNGYGLCYHIIGTAYARHINSVLCSESNRQERQCVKTPVSALTVVQTRHLNPNFGIPYKLIHEVTKEFIDMLHLCQITMSIYWDGGQRYMHKKEIDVKRIIERNTTYYNLQQYCNHGTLPPTETNHPYRKHKTSLHLCNFWFSNFPSSKLYITQIFHTLHATGNIAKVECDNEADAVLARAVYRNPNAYILAFDSDFCFYEDIQYIPIPTMQIHGLKQSTQKTKTYMKACVVTREVLASELHLPDSDMMIEVAILFGNDLITPTTSSNPHQWNNSRIQQDLFSANHRITRIQKEYKLSNDVIVSYLQNQRCGFLLTSSDVEIQETIEFVRRMYNLQQSDQNIDVYKQEDVILEFQLGEISVRPFISEDEVTAMDITIPPTNEKASIKDIVVRSLQNYIKYTHDQDEQPNQGVSIDVTDDHLDAFRELQLNDSHSYNRVDRSLGAINLSWRPNYNDVCVVYLIEKILMELIEKNYATSSMVKLNGPHVIFDPYKYHAQLLLVRELNWDS